MAADNVLNRLNDADRQQIFGNPLNEAEIRLLEVKSSLNDTSSYLDCRMQSSKLDDEAFIAISYYWGNINDNALINVNTRPYRVTKQVINILNLLSTQLYSREIDSSNPANRLRRQLMWIDAVCINQEDVPERERQMKMMKSVYESALCTMLYLGQPPGANEDAKLALDWLKSLIHEPMEEFLAIPKEKRLQRWSSRCWASVVKLLEESPWWRRRWTIQEAAVSNEVWVVYGTEILRWETFADAVTRCAYMWSDLAQQSRFQLQSTVEPMADVSPTFAIARLRTRLRNGEPLPQLFETLLNFRRCGCMYGYERIFALLGLCNNAERGANPIDLKLGTTETFKRFVLRYIGLYKNLDILCAALEIARVKRPLTRSIQDGLWVDPDPPNFAKMEQLSELPSWVPNFTSHRVEWLLGPSLEVNASFSPVFAASHGSPPLPPGLIMGVTSILPVTGIEIDRVLAFHPDSPIAAPKQNTNTSDHWWAYWQWAMSGSNVPHTYPSHDARWVAFLRTLAAGSRCGASDRLLSDAYVRHHGQEFFSGTLLGQFWRDVQGLRGERPGEERDYYSPPWPDAPKDFLPPISFNRLCNFKLIRGRNGRVGLAPPRTKVSDRIVVLFGCSSPLLLEEAPGMPDKFRIRGEAYMHGFMFGEAIQLWQRGLLSSRTFHLL